MADLILDDVNELLLKKKGDQTVLKRIKRAVERGEVVSVYERSYVQGLVSKHLRPEPKDVAKPDIPVVHPPTPRPAEPKKSTGASQASTRTAVIIGVIAAVGVIGALAAYMSGALDAPGSGTAILEIQTDSDSYAMEDIILISGTSTEPSGQVTLSITNPAGDLVWVEDDDIDERGRYSTLAIAGGAGWGAGNYTISAIQGDIEASATFDVSQ